MYYHLFTIKSYNMNIQYILNNHSLLIVLLLLLINAEHILHATRTLAQVERRTRSSAVVMNASGN